MLLGLAHARHRQIDERVLEPALGRGIHREQRRGEQRLRRIGDAYVA